MYFNNFLQYHTKYVCVCVCVCVHSQRRPPESCWGCSAEPRPWSWRWDSSADRRLSGSCRSFCRDPPTGRWHSCRTLQGTHTFYFSFPGICNRSVLVSKMCERFSYVRSACRGGCPQVRCTSVSRCHTVFPSCRQGSDTLLCEDRRNLLCSRTLNGLDKGLELSWDKTKEVTAQLWYSASVFTHSCSRWVRSPSVQERTVCSSARWLRADRRTDRSDGRTAGREPQRLHSRTDDSRCMTRSRTCRPEEQHNRFRSRRQTTECNFVWDTARYITF